MDQDKIHQPLEEQQTLISDADQARSLEPMQKADQLLTAILNISSRLEILQKLGQGGMCAVYKARHLIMNKVVAVKVLLPHLISNPMMLKRFQQEAQATVILNHANIIRIYDSDISSDGYAYIVMDYIDGESLHDLLQQEWRLKPEVALDLFVQLAQGLSHAHDHGIVHRDLKPSNVMLVSDANDHFQVKLVDFGIAKLVQESGQGLTQTGDVFGSPLYMSPEQCSGQKLDSRSDLYSFGCLMYETLAGQPPIVGASPLNTMQMHMTVCAAEFVLPDSTDFLKRNLQKIIFKCLEKSPDERYQTADDLLQDLLDCSQADFAKRTQTGKAQIDLTRLKMPLIVALCALAVALGSWAGYVRCATTIEAPSYYANQPIWNRPIWPLPDPTPFDEQQEHEKLVGQRREDSFHNRGEKKSLAVLGGLLNTADWYREHGGYAEAEKYYLLYRDGQEGKERKAIAEMGIGFSKFKEGDLAEALKCLTKAVDELIAGANPNALPRDLRVDEADTDSDGFILYLTPNAKLAVDHVGFLNELPDVTGADLNKALKYYGTLGEMVTFKVKDEFRRTSKDDKQREIEDDKQKVISSQSAPILCRLGDIDRRLCHANNQSLINFFSAAQGFGKAPDHILDQMKIALGKALVLQPLGRLREAEMALTDALAMKPVDPVLTEQLKPDEDEPRIRGELKHVRAQVRWHQGRYGDALWDQFGPAS